MCVRAFMWVGVFVKITMKNRCAHTRTYVCQTKWLQKAKYSILSENQSYDDNSRMLQSYTLHRLLSNNKQQNDVEKRQNGINFPEKSNTQLEQNGVWCWQRRNKLKWNAFASESPTPSYGRCCIIMIYAFRFKSMHTNIYYIIWFYVRTAHWIHIKW